MKTEGAVITGRIAKHYNLLQELRGGHRVYKKMLSLIEVKSGDQILDVGCGPGTALIALARKYGSSVGLFGIDPSGDMIGVANQNKKNLSIDFKVGVGEKIKFEDSTFDLVISSLVFHHLPRALQEQTTKEMWRILKPKGKVTISDWGEPRGLLGKLIWSTTRNHAFVKENSKGSVLEALTNAGFTEIAILHKQFGIIEHITAKKN